MAESGFFPLVIYYLTTFYRRAELARRLAIFYAASNIANAFSGLLAFGVFRMSRRSMPSALVELMTVHSQISMTRRFLLGDTYSSLRGRSRCYVRCILEFVNPELTQLSQSPSLRSSTCPSPHRRRGSCPRRSAKSRSSGSRWTRLLS